MKTDFSIELLLELLEEVVDLTGVSAGEESILGDDIHVSSSQMLRVLSKVESMCEIRFRHEDYLEMKTLGDILRIVAMRLRDADIPERTAEPFVHDPAAGIHGHPVKMLLFEILTKPAYALSLKAGLRFTARIVWIASLLGLSRPDLSLLPGLVEPWASNRLNKIRRGIIVCHTVERAINAFAGKQGVESISAIVNCHMAETPSGPAIYAGWHHGSLAGVVAGLHRLGVNLLLISAYSIPIRFPENISVCTTHNSDERTIYALKCAEDHIRSGGSVFVTIDGRSGSAQQELRYLDRRVGFSTGAISLSKEFSVPIVPVFARWVPRGIEFRSYDPVSGDGALEDLVRLFESVVKSFPECFDIQEVQRIGTMPVFERDQSS